MTPQSLKSAILQLAIQGKLVPQRPEDGVARVPTALNTEKKKARRHGEEIEPPFDIPETWRWVRLGNVVFNHGQKKPAADFSYIDIGSIDNKKQRLSDNETVVHPEDASPRARKIVHQGDVIYSTVRPYLHNVCVIDCEFSHEPIASTGFAVMACAPCLDNRFLFYFLLSPDFDRYANSSENAKGVAYPAISNKRLFNAPFPLPPLPEQHRIVAKIEELLPLIDRYEQAWTKLEDFTRRFPADMQKSLLQLAIQGQLVDQRPEEGTGEQLYRKILATKNTKKDKKLPPIADDEIPFEIPGSWKWVRFGELGVLKSGYAFKSSEYTSDGLQVVRISDLGDDSIGSKDAVYYPRQDELSSYFVVNGSFLICMTGSIGKMAWVKDGVLRYLNQRVGMFVPNALCFPAYLWYFIHTNHVINGWIRAKTSANGNIKNSDITDLLTPLPPLAEQKRIVAKLEELLPLCERLK